MQKVTQPGATPLYSRINNTKQKEDHPPTLEVVQSYFKQENFTIVEAGKFYHRYQANGWLLGGKTPITDWQAAAHSWLTKSEKFNDTFIKSDKAESKTTHARLHSNPDKDYSEPL